VKDCREWNNMNISLIYVRAREYVRYERETARGGWEWDAPLAQEISVMLLWVSNYILRESHIWYPLPKHSGYLRS
jgi:hypothetical protein